MIIDRSEYFKALQQESKADRDLIKYCRDVYSIELPMPSPETPYIIIDDRMFAWIPNE